MDPEILWKPQTTQYRMLESSADEILFGGAKGGGKSEALLFGALRYVNHNGYKALILRRTYPRLKELIGRSMCFRQLSAQYNKQGKTWTFPGGGTIRFGHCQNPGDELNYQGHQYHYIGFDQVEEFTEEMFLVISACGRKTDDIPVRIRATANPGGVGRIWVRKRWIKDKLPNVKYYTEGIVDGKPLKLSSMFIPSSVYDNKILLEHNPQYVLFLQNLPEKLRRMYLEGDFDAGDDSDQLIPYKYIEKARVKPSLELSFPDSIFLGVDVARFGDDKTEFVAIENGRLVSIEEFEKKDIAEVAALLMNKIKSCRINPENVGIDTVGLGAGVYDILRSQGIKLTEIVSGSKPLEIKGDPFSYRNLRSQMLWHFRERLRTGGAKIAIDDDLFEEEAISLRYQISNEKVIAVESKEEAKRRLGRSTNRLDAAVYADFVRVINKHNVPHLF
ncbi:MAG TPA: terminase family protein [Ignavibacteriales bacterium]|nr:terminase family protein [Ignavibacteriales bacterium]